MVIKQLENKDIILGYSLSDADLYFDEKLYVILGFAVVQLYFKLK